MRLYRELVAAVRSLCRRWSRHNASRPPRADRPGGVLPSATPGRRDHREPTGNAGVLDRLVFAKVLCIKTYMSPESEQVHAIIDTTRLSLGGSIQLFRSPYLL